MKEIQKLFEKFGVHIEVMPNSRYALIPSDDGSHKYIVKEHVFYSCTCPDFQFRNRECKHIRQFKDELEKEEKNGSKNH